jgi:6-phosphofructokinase 1
VGIPKTIDNDLSATDYTLGFDTSVRTVAEIIERSRTPAGATTGSRWSGHGRTAGHLAYWSGWRAARIVLLPETPST